MKEKYIEYVKKNYKDKSLELILNQIELFYSNVEINIKKNYKIGDLVKLSKGTYLHGIPGLLDGFDWIINNGFIGNDFTNKKTDNKIKNSIGMWDIKNDCLLKDYINDYSGFTITYMIGRGPSSAHISKMIPYHKFDEFTEKISNDESIWMYNGEQTKEVRFLPSLVSDKIQIAFILDMSSNYAKEISRADVWNIEYDEELLKDFIDYRYLEKFMVERFDRTAITTDRETAIIFGLPAKLIEGILVGKRIENDTQSLNYIKSKLPNCYICNLDGKIIIN